TNSGPITASTVIFNETNGSWGFQVPPVYSGGLGYRFTRSQTTVSISGVSQTISITFERVYAITFSETGLNPGTSWSLVVAPGSTTLSVANSTVGSTIVVQEPNGSWGYQVANVTGYQLNWWDQLVNVSGHPVLVSVTYSPFTPPGARFNVTFLEIGLLLGTPWSVSIAPKTGFANTNTSTTDAIVEREPNGTWGYQVNNVSGYQLNWWDRSDKVTGAPITVFVDFSLFKPGGPLYTVTFASVGLPSGATWHVDVRNETGSALTPNPVVFVEYGGFYAFSAGAAGGYNISSPLHFDLTGNVTITVGFVPGNYLVWRETGLGPGLTWSVLLNRTSLPAVGGWVQNDTFNGSNYHFTIPVVQSYPGGPSYVPTPQTATFSLTGTGLTTDVRFVEATTPVTFVLTGLPGGSEYQVRLSNSSQLTALSSLEFNIPNGSYTYDVAAPAGYYPTPSHGTVGVHGGSVVISISILPLGRGPNPPFLSLVLPAATTAVVLVLSGVGMFALLGAIRRRRTGAAL
ncbi:MAG: hypothetical protein L3K02_04280, partial [Thermoplasmata archaeon]|nr:hypothetical protein [Thermoplasmata archaeon]